jgi:hypothetical protein
VHHAWQNKQTAGFLFGACICRFRAERSSLWLDFLGVSLRERERQGKGWGRLLPDRQQQDRRSDNPLHGGAVISCSSFALTLALPDHHRPTVLSLHALNALLRSCGVGILVWMTLDRGKISYSEPRGGSELYSSVAPRHQRVFLGYPHLFVAETRYLPPMILMVRTPH